MVAALAWEEFSTLQNPKQRHERQDIVRRKLADRINTFAAAPLRRQAGISDDGEQTIVAQVVHISAQMMKTIFPTCDDMEWLFPWSRL